MKEKRSLFTLASGKLSHTLNSSAPYITDKVDHGYLPAYERQLPSSITKFMEIGVGLTGDGLRMFRDHYQGEGEFHALDCFGNGAVAESELKSEGFVTHKGSQSDIAFLEMITDSFDVIVEDASHHSDEQIITFKHLFVHNVNPGGCYVLEDLCCCRDPYWWRIVRDFDNTFLAVIKRVIAGGDFVSQLITKEESDELLGLLEKAYLECEDGGCIAFMWRKGNKAISEKTYDDNERIV